jgi:ribonuclease III
MKAELTRLEEVLGHRFGRTEILVRALTHRSLINGRALEASAEEYTAAGDNERLEFLGDAVLGLVVGEELFQTYPEWREGELTIMRAHLVSRQHMAEVAAAIGLGGFLRLSKGEERGGLRRTATVLSNAMEAVLGALYLDGGLEPVRAFARRYVMGKAAEELAGGLRAGETLGNYKSALQEYLQSSRAGTPIYMVKGESGPDHRKLFVVEVRLKSVEGEAGKPLARGSGTTKKLAEQDAACHALSRLMTRDAERTGTLAALSGANQEELRSP